VLSHYLDETLHSTEIISHGLSSTKDLIHASSYHNRREASAATKHQKRGIEQVEHWGGDRRRNYHPNEAALLIACLQPVLLEE
jgi:hypothetical protein